MKAGGKREKTMNFITKINNQVTNITAELKLSLGTLKAIDEVRYKFMCKYFFNILNNF